MTRNRVPGPCPVCGGRLVPVSEVREIRIGQRTTVVPDAFSRCTGCGEELYAPGQMEAVQRRASAQIRKDEGLLLPREIREIRESLGLSQQAFERLLGVGPKTVVRWERGTVFQNRATDSLLRIIRAFPQAARFLAARHGIEVGAGAS
ncbi:MAG: type II toxin-antitoxin system MqsA family antitoxin [Longimicrobiales bacterium]